MATSPTSLRHPDILSERIVRGPPTKAEPKKVQLSTRTFIASHVIALFPAIRLAGLSTFDRLKQQLGDAAIHPHQITYRKLTR